MFSALIPAPPPAAPVLNPKWIITLFRQDNEENGDQENEVEEEEEDVGEEEDEEDDGEGERLHSL